MIYYGYTKNRPTRSQEEHPMRVLIIEDDKDICQAISFSMSKEGYEVDVCNEGDDGLRAMREKAHDLVLLDRMLPRLNGLDVLRIARSEGIMDAGIDGDGTGGERSPCGGPGSRCGRLHCKALHHGGTAGPYPRHAPEAQNLGGSG